jgi:hypothetical protein
MSQLIHATGIWHNLSIMGDGFLIGQELSPRANPLRMVRRIIMLNGKSKTNRNCDLSANPHFLCAVCNLRA